MNSTTELTKAEIKTMTLRVAALRAELDDPTCQRFPLARYHVERELERVEYLLARGWR